MTGRNRRLRTIGAILFSAGFVIGFVIFAGMVWADFEGAMFDTAIRGEKRLRTLRCPVVISEKEMGTISATFHNSLDRPVQFAIRTRISQGFVTLMREEKALLPVDAGGTEGLQWTVTPDEAAYGRVILVKVLLMGNYPLPSRQATCGVLVLDVPFLTGSQALALGVSASLAFLALGGALWLFGSWPLEEGFELDLARGMGALAASVLVGMIAGFWGSWLLGVAVVVVTALLFVELIRHVVQRG